MPTFLVFKNGKKVQEVRGADVRGLKMVVEGAAADIKASQPKATETNAPEPKQAEAKVEEKRADGEEKTVSGSYGLSSNNNWKMSLH